VGTDDVAGGDVWAAVTKDASDAKSATLVMELPPAIVGNWCVAYAQMTKAEEYVYVRCKDNNWAILVYPGFFVATGTGCKLIGITYRDNVPIYQFECDGEGIHWREETRSASAKTDGR
jgi:hypothetical protein